MAVRRFGRGLHLHRQHLGLLLRFNTVLRRLLLQQRPVHERRFAAVRRLDLRAILLVLALLQP